MNIPDTKMIEFYGANELSRQRERYSKLMGEFHILFTSSRLRVERTWGEITRTTITVEYSVQQSAGIPSLSSNLDPMTW